MEALRSLDDQLRTKAFVQSTSSFAWFSASPFLMVVWLSQKPPCPCLSCKRNGNTDLESIKDKASKISASLQRRFPHVWKAMMPHKAGLPSSVPQNHRAPHVWCSDEGAVTKNRQNDAVFAQLIFLLFSLPWHKMEEGTMWLFAQQNGYTKHIVPNVSQLQLYWVH